MAKLNLDRQESEFLNETIKHWEKHDLVDAAQAESLRNSYEVKGFDWMRLAKYSMWVALICGAIAVGSVIVDATVLKYIQRLYQTPDIIISIVSAAMAAGLFYLGRRRELRTPEKIFTNEAVIFTGVLFTACSIAYLGKTFDNGTGHYSILFLISVFVYGFLAWRMRSRLIWLLRWYR